MFSSRLALLACLLLAVPAFAAPAPIEPKDDNAWLRALPADTDGLFYADVKAFMASPLVKNGLKGKLPPILGDALVFPVSLKSLGVDPKKDVRGVALVLARSQWNGPDGKPTASGGGLFVYQTTKPSAALQAGLDNAARGAGASLEAVAGAKGKVYQIKGFPGGGYMAALPGGVLAVASNQQLAETTLALARGRKAALKHAEMAKFVKGLKPGAVVRGLMLPDCVMGASSSGFAPAGAPPMTTVKLTTLGESGVQKVTVDVKVKGTLTGVVELECKDAADAAKKARDAQAAMTFLKPALEGQAMKEPALKPVLEVLKTLKIADAGKMLRFQAEVGADAVKALELVPLPGLKK